MSGAHRFLTAACLLATLAWACGAAPPPAAAPPPGTPLPPAASASATMPPAEVAALLHARVTGVTPILLPASIPDGWTASVSASAGIYSVTYAAPDKRRVELATVVPNPPPYVNQSHPAFRGAARALYQWESAADPRSARMLLWEEPGSRWQGGMTRSGDVSYFLTAQGTTDAEFWSIANSLRPV